MNPTVLVVGGAGYIGSHMVKMLARSGHTVVTLGEDFDTPDGTCVRDYIHVGDLCRAHLLAARRLAEGRTSGAEAYNLGIGRGFSVREVIRVCEAVTGVPIGYTAAPRRPGDPPRLVANAAKAREVLGWVPEYVEIARIIGTAWAVHGAGLRAAGLAETATARPLRQARGCIGADTLANRSAAPGLDIRNRKS